MALPESAARGTWSLRAGAWVCRAPGRSERALCCPARRALFERFVACGFWRRLDGEGLHEPLGGRGEDLQDVVSIFSSPCGAISGRLRFAVRRDPSDRNASVQKIDDRLGDLRRDGGTRTNIERPRDFGKKFVERLGSYGRGVAGDALFAPPETRSQR